MKTRMNPLIALVATATLSQAATVSISNFSGAVSLDNVTATASTEYPFPQFGVASAFDDSLTTDWAANGNGPGGTGNINPDATVTLDFSAAEMAGNATAISISTFGFIDRNSGSTPRDQTGTWSVELFLGATSVYDSGVLDALLTNSVNIGGIEADSLVYTVESRVDETGTGNAGVFEFSLTGTAVPEPSAMALFGLGGLALIVLRRR